MRPGKLADQLLCRRREDSKMRRRAVGFLFVTTIGVATITADATITARAQFIQSGRLCLANGAVVDGPTAGLNVQPCPEPRETTAANVPDAPLAPELAQPLAGNNNSTLYWGYEANLAAPSRVFAYRAVVGNPMTANCVPLGPHIPASSNGRGLAFDPIDGNLWISRMTVFTGDARIHKITPPNVTPGTCPELNSLLVHYPGGLPPEQKAFGALDADQASKHIWATGWDPVLVEGQLRNYFYLVNRNNGLITQSCFMPATDIFQGNDSLTYARLFGLPGSGQYLLTDNGAFTGTDPILVLDTSECHNGQLITPVWQFPKVQGMTGIDFEWLGLLYSNIYNIRNAGNQPFPEPHLFLGLTAPADFIQDISICGYRAKFGGGGNDSCPYQ
jgi:hypothetical protein